MLRAALGLYRVNRCQSDLSNGYIKAVGCCVRQVIRLSNPNIYTFEHHFGQLLFYMTHCLLHIGETGLDPHSPAWPFRLGEGHPVPVFLCGPVLLLLASLKTRHFSFRLRRCFGLNRSTFCRIYMF